jgi:peptide deformylase
MISFSRKSKEKNPLDGGSSVNSERKIKQIEMRSRLREYPDPILRRTALPVAKVRSSVGALLRRMARVMYDREGIGMAAPQIGVLQRLIIADIGEGLLSIINPEILDRRGEASLLEGCLSLPNVGVNVTRNESIIIRGIDAAEREITRDLSGLMARVIQHEIDHLNGALIIDYGNRRGATGRSSCGVRPSGGPRPYLPQDQEGHSHHQRVDYRHSRERCRDPCFIQF